MDKEPILTNCDAHCAWCGMKHICTASPYSMNKMKCYYEITRRNNDDRENEQAVKELYNQGLNPEDIADELGLDECEVMDYCAEILGD